VREGGGGVGWRRTRRAGTSGLRVPPRDSEIDMFNARNVVSPDLLELRIIMSELQIFPEMSGWDREMQ
jgi:hypothetical protein